MSRLTTYYYVDRKTGELVAIPSGEEPPEGADIVNAENPHTTDTQTSTRVEEEDIVEFKQKYIQAEITLMPYYLDLLPGEIHTVFGCGEMFSGDYYVTNVSLKVTPGEMDVELTALRTNLLPASEQESFRQKSLEPPEPEPVEEPPRPPREEVEEEPQTRYHIVGSGETLRSIAQRYYGDPDRWEIIYYKNARMLIRKDPRNFDNPGMYIYQGQRLEIP